MYYMYFAQYKYEIIMQFYFFLISYLKFLIDQPKTSFEARLEVANLTYEEAYEDLENPITKALIKRIEKAVRPTNLACFS